MKCFLILLAASLTASDKLDRTYLPPPGAQFAGGHPGDILAPLETPNLSQTGLIPVHSIPNKFNEFEPTGQPIQLPVTTTSYAFSQTTTFPIENFDTTAVPINPVTGLPIQNVGPFSNLQHNQPVSLDQKGDEINIGSSFPRQPISDQHVSNIDSVKYPNGQSVNENFNQYSIDGVNSGPIFQTTEAVAQVQGINQYPDEQNSLNPQGPSTVSGQANIIPNHQYGNLQNIGGSPEYIQPDNRERQMSLDIMQPYLNQDYQNEGTPISSNNAEQQSPPENRNTLNLGSILEKNNYQPGQAHDEVFSTTPSFTSSGSIIPSRSHINRPPRPQAAGDRSAVILKYDNTRTPDGYSYSFETSNGIRADESGTVGDGTKAQGSYSYTGDDGKVYSVFYTADENGFQPRGEHLPTSPPIPDAIRKVIEQAARDEAAGIFDDGSYDENKYGYKNHYLPENQLFKHRNKVERKKIRPASDKNKSQQFNETSDIRDTNMSGDNYPTSKISGNNEENNNSGKSDVRGSYFSEPSENEEESSYLKNGDSAGHISDLNRYMQPILGEYIDQQNIHDSRDRYSLETGGVEGTMQSRSQYPGPTTSSTNNKIDNSDNGGDLKSIYDNGIISENEQPKSGQSSPYPSRTFSKISNRKQNEYQTPFNDKESGVLNNQYTKGNTPQAGQVFSPYNMKDFESKRIDNPAFTDYSQNSNNQSANQKIIPQLSENGYYYNVPQYQFGHTEFPTRFKGEEVSSTTKPVSKNPTRKPFLTPEVHNQPTIRKEYRGDFSTTPQPFMTSSVITQKDDYNPDYENEKDYIFDEDTDNRDVSTTTRPSDNDRTTLNQLLSYKENSILPSSLPSEFSSTENPSKNTKSQQLHRPNSGLIITSNNRNPQILNNKYQTTRPAHNFEEKHIPNYSSNIVKPNFANHMPTESKKSSEPVPTGVTLLPNTPEYQTRFEPSTSKYQNHPVKSDYNTRPQIPKRFDFESIPSNYRNINAQTPADYSVTKNASSKLDKPGIFILSEPRPSTPESSPVGTQGFTTPANTILSSTPNLFSSTNANSPGTQISQILPSTYQYRPPKPLFSTTASPTTVATTPNFFIPSTQPSLLPEFYSTTPQHPSHFSPPDIFHHNPIVDGFGNPIIPELRSVFSTPDQNASLNAGIHYPGEKDFRKPEESSIGTNNSPSGDEGRPTYTVEQAPTYSGYNNPTRVIGEDFSGPKQPQRYDAQTGYHYK